MKKTLEMMVVSVTFGAALSAHAALNLVTDPTFSPQAIGPLTGSTTPWFSPSSSSVITNSMPLSGATENAVISAGGLLDQIIGESAGTGYTINIWLANPSGSTGSLFVHLGASSTTISVPANSGYVDYDIALTTINTAALTLQSTGGTVLDVGEVSVAVPEPTTMVAGALMLLPFAASTLRLRKKTDRKSVV